MSSGRTCTGLHQFLHQHVAHTGVDHTFLHLGFAAALLEYVLDVEVLLPGHQVCPRRIITVPRDTHDGAVIGQVRDEVSRPQQ